MPENTSEHTIRTSYGSRRVKVPVSWKLSKIEIWKMDPSGKYQEHGDFSPIRPEEAYILQPDKDLPGMVKASQVRITPSAEELKHLDEQKSEKYFTRYTVQAGDTLQALADPVSGAQRASIHKLYDDLKKKREEFEQKLAALPREQRAMTVEKLARTDGLRIPQTMPCLWDVLDQLELGVSCEPWPGKQTDENRCIVPWLKALPEEQLKKSDVCYIAGTDLKGDMDLTALFSKPWTEISIGEETKTDTGWRLTPSETYLGRARKFHDEQVQCSYIGEDTTNAERPIKFNDGAGAWFRAAWDVEVDTKAEFDVSWSKVRRETDGEKTRYIRTVDQGGGAVEIVTELGKFEETGGKGSATFTPQEGGTGTRSWSDAGDYETVVTLPDGRVKTCKRVAVGDGWSEVCSIAHPDGSKEQWTKTDADCRYAKTNAQGTVVATCVRASHKEREWTSTLPDGTVIREQRSEPDWNDKRWQKKNEKTGETAVYVRSHRDRTETEEITVGQTRRMYLSSSETWDDQTRVSTHSMSFEQKDAAGANVLSLQGFIRFDNLKRENLYRLITTVGNAAPTTVEGAEDRQVKVNIAGKEEERSIYSWVDVPACLHDAFEKCFAGLIHEVDEATRTDGSLPFNESELSEDSKDYRTLSQVGKKAVNRRYTRPVGAGDDQKVLEAETEIFLTEHRGMKLPGDERLLTTKIFDKGAVVKIQELRAIELGSDKEEAYELISAEERKTDGTGVVRHRVRKYIYEFSEKTADGTPTRPKIQREERLETWRHKVPEGRNQLVNNRLHKQVRAVTVSHQFGAEKKTTKFHASEEFDRYITEFCILGGGGNVYVVPGQRRGFLHDPTTGERLPRPEGTQDDFIPSHASYKGVETGWENGAQKYTFPYVVSRSIRLGDMLEDVFELHDAQGKVTGTKAAIDPFREILGSLGGDAVIREQRERWDIYYNGNLDRPRPTFQLKSLTSSMKLLNYRGEVLGTVTLKHPIEAGADPADYRFEAAHNPYKDYGVFGLSVFQSADVDRGFCCVDVRGLRETSSFSLADGSQRTLQFWNPARVQYELTAGAESIGHGVLVVGDDHDGALYLVHENLGDPGLEGHTRVVLPGEKLAEQILVKKGPTMQPFSLRVSVQQDAYRFRPVVRRLKATDATPWEAMRAEWFAEEARLRGEITKAISQGEADWRAELAKDGLTDEESKRLAALKHLVEQPLLPIELYRANADLLRDRLRTELQKAAVEFQAKKDAISGLEKKLAEAVDAWDTKQKVWQNRIEPQHTWEVEGTKPTGTLADAFPDLKAMQQANEELEKEVAGHLKEMASLDDQLEAERKARQNIQNRLTDPLACLTDLLESGKELRIPKVFAQRGIPYALRSSLWLVMYPFPAKADRRLEALKAGDLPHSLVLTGFLRGVPDGDEARNKLAQVQPATIGEDPKTRIGWGMRFIWPQEDSSIQFIPEDSSNEKLRGCAIWRGSLVVCDNNRHPDDAEKFLRRLKLYGTKEGAGEKDSKEAPEGLDKLIETMVATLEPPDPSADKQVSVKKKEGDEEVVEDFVASGIPCSPYRAHFLETMVNVYDRRFLSVRPRGPQDRDEHSYVARPSIISLANGNEVTVEGNTDLRKYKALIDKYKLFMWNILYLRWRIEEQNLYWSHTWITDSSITEEQERNEKRKQYNFFYGYDTSDPDKLRDFWDKSFGDYFGSMLQRVIIEDRVEQEQPTTSDRSAPGAGQGDRLQTIPMERLPGRLQSSPIHATLRQRIAGPDSLGLRMLPAEVAEAMGAFERSEEMQEAGQGLFVNNIDSYKEHGKLVKAYEVYLEDLKKRKGATEAQKIQAEIDLFWSRIKRELGAAFFFHLIKLGLFVLRRAKVMGKMSDKFFDPNNAFFMSLFNVIEAWTEWKDVGLGAASANWKAHDVWEAKKRASARGYSNIKQVGYSLFSPQFGMDNEADEKSAADKAYESWREENKRATETSGKKQAEYQNSLKDLRAERQAGQRARVQAGLVQAQIDGMKARGEGGEKLAALQSKQQAHATAHAESVQRRSEKIGSVKKKAESFRKAEEVKKKVRKTKVLDKGAIRQEVTEEGKDGKTTKTKRFGERTPFASGGYDYDPMACLHKVFAVVGYEAKIGWSMTFIWWLLKLTFTVYIRVVGSITFGWQWRSHTPDDDKQEKKDDKGTWSDVRRHLHRSIYASEADLAAVIIDLHKQDSGAQDRTDLLTDVASWWKHGQTDTTTRKFGRKTIFINNAEGDEAGNWDDRLDRWISHALEDAYPQFPVKETNAQKRTRALEMNKALEELRASAQEAGTPAAQLAEQEQELQRTFFLQQPSLVATLDVDKTNKVPCPACQGTKKMQDPESPQPRRVDCRLCEKVGSVNEHDLDLYNFCQPAHPLRYLVVPSKFWAKHRAHFQTNESKAGGGGRLKYGYFVQALWNNACQTAPGVSQVQMYTTKYKKEDGYDLLNDMWPATLPLSMWFIGGEIQVIPGLDIEVAPIWDIILDQVKDNPFLKAVSKAMEWCEVKITGNLSFPLTLSVDKKLYLQITLGADASVAFHCLGFTAQARLLSAKILWGDWWLGARQRQSRLEFMAGETIILERAYNFMQPWK